MDNRYFGMVHMINIWRKVKIAPQAHLTVAVLINIESGCENNMTKKMVD